MLRLLRPLLLILLITQTVINDKMCLLHVVIADVSLLLIAQTLLHVS